MLNRNITAHKKIALLGSAPSSCRLAPYQDQEWAMWGCSPALYPVAERIDVWFEMHRWEPPIIGKPEKQVPWFSPEYVQWLGLLGNHGVPVFMADVVPEVPSSVRLPREELLAKYGPYFFTSSLAWMFALALEQEGVEEIGMWGVDMSAAEEYGQQRSGCQHFMWLAKERGIKVTLPPESDLMQPPMLYGIGETDHKHAKWLVRKKELDARLLGATQRRDGAHQEIIFLQGALDNLNYMLSTWVTDAPSFDPPAHPETLAV